MDRSPLLRAVAGALPALTVLATAAGPAAPATAAEPGRRGVLVGVVGNHDDARQRTGRPLAEHDYARFSQRVPAGRMITVRFDADWAVTAAVAHGTPAHADLVRWGRTLAERSGRTYLAFHHEPESTHSASFGTAEEYKAAFRRVVGVLRAQAGDKLISTWQMTSWAFRADPEERVHAGRWYPGDAYVDVVGADPYNWYRCGHGLGRWNSLRDLVDPVVGFARAHGKQVVLPEFASDAHQRRARWLRRATDYLARRDRHIAAVFYFHRAATNPEGADCQWGLSTRAEYRALRAMAADPRLRG